MTEFGYYAGIFLEG